MTKVLVIAWREFKATVFNWAFMLSVAVLPVMAVVTSFAVPFLAGASGVFDDDSLSGEVLVLDASLATAMATEADGDDELERLQVVPVATPLDDALARLEAEEVLAVVAVEDATTLYLATGPLGMRRALTNWIGSSRARHRAEEAGVDVDAVRKLLKRTKPDVVVLSDGDADADSSERALRHAAELLVSVAGEMLLWLGVFVSAQYLLQNTVEERSSKVMEVLLSAVSPMQLMAGKILGLGAVGLLMTSVYGITGIAGLIAFAMLDLLTVSDVLLFALFYAIAYLQMGSFFAAIGSAVNEMREAQSLMTPAILLMTVPFLCLPLLLDNPNGNVAVGLSLVPPLTPYVMIFRLLMPSNVVPLWQIAVSLLLSGGWAALMLWASARVFRVGVLMSGKAPSLRELARWVLAP